MLYYKSYLKLGGEKQKIPSSQAERSSINNNIQTIRVLTEKYTHFKDSHNSKFYNRKKESLRGPPQ